MKSCHAIQLSLLLLVSFFLHSCNGSEKGKWSKEDKQKFREELNNIKELENFGSNKAKWIECYLSKCEANYSSFSEADRDAKGCEKYASECNEDVLANGSTKGKWSSTDKDAFRKDMDSIEELAEFGDKRSAWIECYLLGCEAKYNSYYHANQDEAGCKQIANGCSASVLQ